MPKTNNNLMWKYAGMVMQFFTAICISVFVGFRMDAWWGLSEKHIFAVTLPLLTIIGLIIKVFIDTGSKK